MSLFSDIIGHKEQCDYLDRVFAQDNLAHAYVFSGPEHVGKESVARCLFAENMNVFVVERPVDEKTGKMKKAIPVESIRDLRAHLQLTSFDGKKKVAIVKEADTMTIAAQNAFLKTLEEPKGESLIILIASNANLLLETIRSRSVHLTFSPVTNQAIKEAIGKQTDAKLAEKIANYASGRPGVALDLVDEDRRFEHEECLLDAKNFLTGSFAARVKMIEALVKEKDPSRLSSTIQLWRQIVHDCFLIASGNGAHVHQSTELADLATKHSILQWSQALKSLSSAELSISKNVNANIALEQFAIQLGL